MPEICTCGAELLPESRFCHKCGRPLREETAVVDVAPAQVPVSSGLPPETVALLSPSFHNPIAIRAGLLAASIATLLNLVLIYGFVI
ncbi:MAG: zinc-ribbon domain-containing protein, partial [Phycisphaerales bacterium]|nr:zinc-ribbon domain-containing protein [Phycisphaerales bacterium]